MPRRFRHEFGPVRVWLTGIVLVAGCASSGEPGPGAVPDGGADPSRSADARREAGPTLAEVEAARAAGDLNEALNLLDRYLPAHPEDASSLALFGQLNLDFAEQLLAQGQGGGGVVAALLADAQSAYERVIAREPRSAADLAGLARALRMQGQNEAAWENGLRAMTLTQAAESPELAVLEEVGRTGLALTKESVQAGMGVPSAARVAERALRQAREAGGESAALVLSDLLAWEGLRQDARDVLLDALDQAPDSVELIGRLKNLAASPDALVADLETARGRHADSATLLWYLGEARYQQSLARRQAADFPRAHEALDRAEECFILAMNQELSYESTCQAWLHLVRTARGWTLREEGRVDDAGSAFVAALTAAPELLEPTPEPWSLRLGIYAIIDDYFQAGNLEMARAFLRRVTEIHRDNPDWMNNLGLVCRELGVAAQDAGEAEEAQELFEEAWAAYSRCVELSPEDPRLVNDRALISVYYLDHDWELAESELHRAVELGAARLDSLPESVTQAERRTLEEAVGDAWENLAYLDVMRRKRIDRAEGYLEKALGYFPYQARSGVQAIRSALRELTGEAEPPSGDNP